MRACSHWFSEPARNAEYLQPISLASISSAGAPLLDFDALISFGIKQSKPSPACNTPISGHLLTLLAVVGLEFSWAFPQLFLKKAHVFLGRLHLAVLGQKDACHNVPGLASREETIFTTSTGKIQKELELNSGQVTACCWMLICSLYKQFRPNYSGNLQETIFHLYFSALLTQTEMNPESTKSLKVKKEQ